MRLTDVTARLSDHVRDAIMVTQLDDDDPDRRSRVVWTNPAFTRLTGYAPEEIAGETTRVLDGPDTDAAALTHMRARLRENGHAAAEIVQYRKDGAAFDAAVEVQRVSRPGDAPEFWVVVLRDISEENRLKTELKQTNLLLRQVLELSGIGTWEVLTADNVVRWDGLTKKIHEVPPDYAPDMDTALSFYPPEAREAVQAAVARGVEAGESWELETPFVTASGRAIWVRSAGQAEYRNGEPYRLYGMFEDITERMERGIQLETLSRRLDVALEAARAGVWELEVATNVLSWDERMFEVYGVSDPGRPLRFEDWQRCVHPDDLEDASAAVTRTLQGGPPFEQSFRVITEDGEVRHIHGRGLVHETSDKGTVFTGVNWDVTREVRLREELVSRRREAEAANLAKSQFLATMSHEIRTPLNGVLGMAQLLQMSELTEKQSQYARTILSSGESLLGLIDDVLDIAKIEADRLELENRAFDLRAAVRAATDTVQAQALEKGLALTTEIDPALPAWVMGDDKRVRQVLINLLGNAVKFTSAGRVDVSVTRGDGAAVRFEVADTGPGVPEDQQELIFDRFAQADMSATREHGGAGMGLAIARDLVRHAGGDIGVKSRPEGGSLFWFSWPLLDGLSTGAPKPASSGSRACEAAGAVLVAEDNPVNAELMEEFLRACGYEPELVSDGQAALERLRRTSYAAVLLDLHMPSLTGEAVIRTVRGETGPNRQAPLFILTADASKGLVERLSAAGADRCFSKPLNLAELGLALGEGAGPALSSAAG